MMIDMLIRRLRQAQMLVAFGCGVWLIVLAKGDDFNLMQQEGLALVIVQQEGLVRRAKLG